MFISHANAWNQMHSYRQCCCFHENSDNLSEALSGIFRYQRLWNHRSIPIMHDAGKYHAVSRNTSHKISWPYKRNTIPTIHNALNFALRAWSNGFQTTLFIIIFFWKEQLYLIGHPNSNLTGLKDLYELRLLYW